MTEVPIIRDTMAVSLVEGYGHYVDFPKSGIGSHVSLLSGSLP